jgi:phenylpropionate dioxygenase-like ring-hydroxylating dioxygenase large terminal subunit
MWNRVWQMACRVEEIPTVGDHIIYEVGDYSLIVVRSRPNEIRAFHNACLHRGRILRETGGHVSNFTCKFHGFTWRLDGTLSFVPGRWDFPQIKDEEFCLPEAKVGVWGGFVFVNLDPNAMSLEDYLSDIPAHFQTWDFEHRYKALHIGKIVPRVNWKVAIEAFLEALHIPTTHPQVMTSTSDLNSQYDLRQDRPHFSRLLFLSGVPSPLLGKKVSEQQILDSLKLQLGRLHEDLPLPPGKTARAYAAELMRERMTQLTNGRDFSNVSDSEMLDGIVYFLFPNFFVWGGYANLIYRFRPWANDPEQALMEIIVLPPVPKDAPVPPPASMHLLGPDETFADAKELGDLGPFFNQDLGNMEWVQKGLRATRKPGVTLARYQESQIRHFHRTLDLYLYGENGRR